MYKFGVVVQGRAISHNHLKKVVESYIKAGASKIVVSVYPEFIYPGLANLNNVEVVPVVLTEEESSICNHTRVTFNYQIISTNRGLQKMEGVDFVLRTRADMLHTNVGSRIHKWVEKIREFDYGVDSIFKSKIVWWKELPKAHIVTDFWQFGYLSDIKKLYNIPLVKYNNFKNGKVSEIMITCGYLRNFYNSEPYKNLHPDATLENNLTIGSDFDWMEVRDRYFLFDMFLEGTGKHTLTPYGCSKGWKQYDDLRKQWMNENTFFNNFNTSKAYIDE